MGLLAIQGDQLRRSILQDLRLDDGYHTQEFLPIIRTDAGGFFGLGEYDGPLGDSFAGRFAQLMPPHAATAYQRTLARQLLDAMGLTEAVLGGTPVNN